MATTKRRWESWEEKLIKKEIKKHPNNLRECFKICALKLNRTPKAVSDRWYYTISKKNSSCFMVLSSTAGVKNRKNSKYNYKITITKNIWNSIVKLFR